ncbi:succinate dehydrogenase cytochrome b subunit [Nocardioides sp. GY 10127]|uniref:succinate dehydrogenase cytochrome b subunit n=1 Tax=Nocardioides sp. GY 10127 TaxID=2569762 RepID=UPI0010A7B309|nr:succinate dehydrogenase cytochrome b subunit [Nocardioides sp. GY 10127]TIC84299.1 succinate dehydrogenase cytochrome b subunit [Nocardioides sp. GY 10127]
MATPTLVRGARASRSTIALKILMASTGLVFIAFVLLHMYGNLHAFAGEENFNEYAEHLRTIGEPMVPYGGVLWIIRIVLIVSLVAHVWSASQLWRRSNEARRTRYAVKKNVHSSLSSRTMRWGGVTILLFLIWHLLEFTIGKVNVAGGATNNPYELLVDSFQVWWLTIIYLVAMVALGLHLHHGTWSAMQTLGFTGSPMARRRAKIAGWVVAVVIAGGFSLVPLFTLFGVITY